MKFLAGIVTYNPNLKRLEENISAIIHQVHEILIFDNSSVNVEQIELLIKGYKSVFLVKSNSNIGVSGALSHLMKYAKKSETDWIITLDQDSVCAHGLIDRYCERLSCDIGIITCEITDRNIKHKTKNSNLKNESNDVYVDYCITSGSFINVKAYSEISGFDQQMFIDKVDFDLCLQFRKQGYLILKINFMGLLHEVGKSQTRHFLGFGFVVYNHEPIRRYYMSRNAIYLAKKHAELSVPYELLRELKRIFLVLMFENRKFKKLHYSIMGLVDGFSMKAKTY